MCDVGGGTCGKPTLQIVSLDSTFFFLGRNEVSTREKIFSFPFHTIVGPLVKLAERIRTNNNSVMAFSVPRCRGKPGVTQNAKPTLLLLCLHRVVVVVVVVDNDAFLVASWRKLTKIEQSYSILLPAQESACHGGKNRRDRETHLSGFFLLLKRQRVDSNITTL